MTAPFVRRSSERTRKERQRGATGASQIGHVFASRNGGRLLEHRGEIGGEPAALLVQSANELYVALHDGTIKRSVDGGASWTVRSTP